MTNIGEEVIAPQYLHEVGVIKAQCLAIVATIGGEYQLWMSIDQNRFFVVEQINPHPPRIKFETNSGVEGLRQIADLVEIDLDLV